MAIDFQSPVGRVRLRVSDIGDLPFLPDEVYNSAIEEANGNLPQAAKTCAGYILGLLSLKTHKKMVQLEVWGSEAYSNYKDFLIQTLTNPAFMSYSPIPYGVSGNDVVDPIQQFICDWNNNWNTTTVSENMHITAWGSDVNY